jgi:hypothetical protein
MMEEIKSSKSSANSPEKLEVTIIPVDEEAYSKTINMPTSSTIGKYLKLVHIHLFRNFKLIYR